MSTALVGGRAREIVCEVFALFDQNRYLLNATARTVHPKNRLPMAGCRGFHSSWVQPMGVDAMGTVYKKTVTRPLPANANIKERRRRATARELRRDPNTATICETVATWTDRAGRKRTAVVVVGSDGLTRIREEAATYTAKYRDADGIVQEVATGCRDIDAAKVKLTELSKAVEKIKCGSLSRSDAEVGKWQNVPLSVHVADYIADLKARGLNADRVKTSEAYLNNDCDGCGFKWLRDLNADALRKWLRSDSEMGAATYNWHSALWSAFGSWLCGIRLDGRRKSQTGDRRIASNPFAGFGKKNERDNRRRIARALTLDEMRRLLDQARRRPLDDALTIRRGKNKGQQTAKLSPERRAELERLGHERALIYKTLILTGLRKNELRTLAVGDLSFGDVPFLVLRSANEKNRKGSTVPLRSDLAAELQDWTRGRSPKDLVFNVPAGLLRILNRDLVAAGIDKIDERDCRVHLHALRHSTGTALSMAGVSPRTAQAVMRHSDIALTMNTYTDQRLLDTSAAVELLPELPLAGPTAQDNSVADIRRDTGKVARRVVAPTVVPATGIACQTGSKTDKIGKICRPTESGEKTKKPRDLRGFNKSGRQDLNLRPLRPERSALPG
jgi:integrase